MDSKQIKSLAALARLELTDDEAAKMGEELTQLLDYVAQLQAVNVDEVQPTSQVTGKMNVLRADEPAQRTEAELLERRTELLANAPDVHEGYVRVPGVFGSSDE